MKNNAHLPNKEPDIAAGIQRNKNGDPSRFEGEIDNNRKNNIRKTLRILDEQQAVNRYKFDGQPMHLTSQEMERLIYYKGQLVMFKLADKFYLMPYALDGGIDFYGREKRVHPVPFSSGTDKETSIQRNMLEKIKIDVIYNMKEFDDPNKIINPETSGVILYDYTKQISNKIISRQELQEGVIDIMSDCIPFMRTALLNATGVEGMGVNEEDEANNVWAASKAINQAALDGQKFIPIKKGMQAEFQELTGGNLGKAEEFMQAMQSLDNYRKSLYGLENSGLFEKKSHMLQEEQDMNGGSGSSPLEDGLLIRQNFCDIANKLWGINMTVAINQDTMPEETDEPMNDETEEGEDDYE